MSISLILLAIVLTFKLIPKLMKLVSIIVDDEAANSSEASEPTIVTEEPQSSLEVESHQRVLSSAATTKSKNKASQQHKIGKKTTAPDAQHITAIAESGEEEGETGENSNVLSEIAKNFDLRSAVIYSEIMTPKFKENE